MIRAYLPALVFVGLGTFLGLTFAVLNTFLGPKKRASNTAQGDPYECGLPSHVQKNFRFGISFYLVAMLFILFDIEVIFLFPIAVSFVAEQLRVTSAETVLHDAGLENAKAVGALDEARQRSVVLAIVRREMGVMTAAAFVVAFLALRAWGTA